MLPTGSRILIVDDQITVRKIAVKALREMGFENLVEAADGLQAWHLVREQEFDLVVSAWQMPSSDGLEFLRRVRSEVKYRKLPFAFVIDASEETKLRALADRLNVTGYWHKPLTVEIVRRYMAR